jgi:hypothetical protein
VQGAAARVDELASIMVRSQDRNHFFISRRQVRTAVRAQNFESIYSFDRFNDPKISNYRPYFYLFTHDPRLCFAFADMDDDDNDKEKPLQFHHWQFHLGLIGFLTAGSV